MADSCDNQRALSIVEYSAEYEQSWDKFVLTQSSNGTFLQTRNFLNYHPQGRFEDASAMVLCGEEIVAVCPACVHDEGKGLELFSHKGSTYGGIIVSKKWHSAEQYMSIVDAFDLYWKSKYSKVTLKQTSAILSENSRDLLEFILMHKGFYKRSDLNLFIDLEKIPESVIDKFDRNKKRNIAKCEKENLIFRELRSDEEVCKFHDLLTINLTKYGVSPIHTKEELIDFRNERLKDNTKFCGVFNGENMLAAGMLFVFSNVNVIHAQNLSADYRFKDYSPITYLYYKVIEMAKREGFSKLSWGISSENMGGHVNWGLVRNKESYGSEYSLNDYFIKEY